MSSDDYVPFVEVLDDVGGIIYDFKWKYPQFRAAKWEGPDKFLKLLKSSNLWRMEGVEYSEPVGEGRTPLSARDHYEGKGNYKIFSRRQKFLEPLPKGRIESLAWLVLNHFCDGMQWVCDVQDRNGSEIYSFTPYEVDLPEWPPNLDIEIGSGQMDDDGLMFTNLRVHETAYRNWLQRFEQDMELNRVVKGGINPLYDWESITPMILDLLASKNPIYSVTKIAVLIREKIKNPPSESRLRAKIAEIRKEFGVR